MSSSIFHAHFPEASRRSGRQPVSLADDESLVKLRCSVVVVRGFEVLLLRRTVPRGSGEWVLPVGRQRTGEGMLSCTRREVAKETGLRVTPTRRAFVADILDPRGSRRRAELLSIARVFAGDGQDLVGEQGVEPCWVPVDGVRRLHLLPPIAGFLPDLVRGRASTAPYLGNVWCDQVPLDDGAPR